MKIIPIGCGTAMAVQLYKVKSGDEPYNIGPIEEVEISARKLVDAFEGNVCIAFLEALILESKKEINRHAVVCESYSDEWNPPEWATKYADVGV
jgi:hypothetical protein